MRDYSYITNYRILSKLDKDALFLEFYKNYYISNIKQVNHMYEFKYEDEKLVQRIVKSINIDNLSHIINLYYTYEFGGFGYSYSNNIVQIIKDFNCVMEKFKNKNIEKLHHIFMAHIDKTKLYEFLDNNLTNEDDTILMLAELKIRRKYIRTHKNNNYF